MPPGTLPKWLFNFGMSPHAKGTQLAAHDSGNCSLLTTGTYPARWTKGKLEVIGWRLGSQKTYKSEYAIVAENCEMPFTCR